MEATAHAYLHSLPRHQEEIINNMLRAYKINFMELNTQEVVQHGSLDFDVSEYITIPAYDNDWRDRRKIVGERKKLEHRSRAKVKRETQRLIDRYYEGEDYR